MTGNNSIVSSLGNLTAVADMEKKESKSKMKIVEQKNETKMNETDGSIENEKVSKERQIIELF